MESTQTRSHANKKSPCKVPTDLSLKGLKMSQHSLELACETDSSISISYDSSLDSDYKSDHSSPHHKSGTETFSTSSKLVSPSEKKDYSSRFDSGLGTDYCTPVTSETDICIPDDDILKASLDESAYKESIEELTYSYQDFYNQDKEGDTVLHLAIVEAKSDVIFPIISSAPHPDFLDIQNDLLQTPLQLAALTGKSNIARRLVAAGATLDIQDHNGNTALHIAAKNGDLDCVKALVQPIEIFEIEEASCLYKSYPQKIDLSNLINLKNYDGKTGLHLAAMGGFKKVVECLYEYGTNINDKEGKSGKTALHYAVENANLDLVKLLLYKCHAVASTKNYAGQSPFFVASSLCKIYPHELYISTQEILKKTTNEKFESSSDGDNDNSSNDEVEK